MLHNYQILVFMHRYVYHRNELPAIFSIYFEEKKFIHQSVIMIHDVNTNNFYTHCVHTEFGRRSIKYKGCKLWNNLPDYIYL